MEEQTKTTIIYPEDSIYQAVESFSLDYQYDRVPIHLDCRLLGRGSSDRFNPEEYDHPDPPFSRVFLFEKGSASVQVKGGVKRTLQAGRIYLLPARMLFHVRYEVSLLHYIHLYLSDISGHSVFELQHKILEIDNQELFRNIITAMSSNDSVMLFAYLMGAMRNLLEPLMPQLVERSVNAQKFSILFNWLRDKQPAAVTVDQAAELYQITSSAFSKRFQRTMGVSFKEYLTIQQIRQAQQQLIYTDKKISEIAAILGYSCPQYFHCFFQKHCQQTPEGYRRKMRGKIT